MQESREILPHITTKEELDALYKNIKANKETQEIVKDPEVITKKIIAMYNILIQSPKTEYEFKKADEKGKREYKISLGQHEENYKTIEIVFNKTIRYTYTIRENEGTEIKIGRYEDKNEEIYIFKKTQESTTYTTTAEIADEKKKAEADMIINDLYEYVSTFSPTQE